MMKTIWRTK